MKNSVWVGVSLTLLASVANAQTSGSNQSEILLKSSAGKVAPFEVSVQGLDDGGVLLVKSDGGQMILPKDMVKMIQDMELDKGASYRGSAPCVIYTK